MNFGELQTGNKLIDDNIGVEDGKIVGVTFWLRKQMSPTVFQRIAGIRPDSNDIPIHLFVGDRYQSYVVKEFRIKEHYRLGTVIEAVSECDRIFGLIHERVQPRKGQLRIEYFGRYVNQPANGGEA